MITTRVLWKSILLSSFENVALCGPKYLGTFPKVTWLFCCTKPNDWSPWVVKYCTGKMWPEVFAYVLWIDQMPINSTLDVRVPKHPMSVRDGQPHEANLLLSATGALESSRGTRHNFILRLIFRKKISDKLSKILGDTLTFQWKIFFYIYTENSVSFFSTSAPPCQKFQDSPELRWYCFALQTQLCLRYEID